MAGNEVRERSFLQSCLDVLIQSILLVFLLISPWFYGLTLLQDKLLAEIFIFGFFLGVVPFLDRRENSSTRQNTFDISIFLCLGLSFVYVIFSQLPYQSLLAFCQLLGCVVFYGLIRWVVRTDKAFWVFLWAILVIGLFYSVYGLLQYYGFLSQSFWSQPLVLSSRYINGSHFGTLLLFPLFIGISLLASNRKMIAQAALIFSLLILGWALLLTHSRAPWIAFAVGLGVFVSLAGRNRFLRGKNLWGMAVFFGVGVLLFLSGGGLDQILRRFGELQRLSFYSLIYRGQLWEGALAAIRERPWGWGIGTLSAVLPRFRVQSDRFFIDYAHNEFLQVGVDLGIPGMLFLAALLFFYFQKARSFLKREGTTDSQKAIAAGFLALWVSLVLVSQVDFPLRIYATGVLFAAFLGLSAHFFEGPPSFRFFRKGPGVLMAWLVVFAANFVTARQLFAEFHFKEGKRLERNFSWKEAQGEYEKAVRLSPFFARYQEVLGYLYEERAKITFDPNQQKNFIKEAIRAYQEAIRLEPYRALTHYLLALLYDEGNESLRAQSEFLKAAALEPTNAIFVAEYGHFAVRHSLTEEALASFEKVKNLPFREGPKTDFNANLRLCYRLTQDPDQLRRIVPDNLGGYTTLAYFLAENGRWDLARKEFEALTETEKKRYSNYRKYFENAGRLVANFYLSHNRFREALAIYREADSLLPNDEEIKRKLEEIHEHLSRA